MEDVLQMVFVKLWLADLQRLQRIIALNAAYRVACGELVAHEDRVKAMALELDKAVWPDEENLPENPVMKNRFQVVMSRYSSLAVSDGLFALELREHGFIDAWLLELEFEIQVETDDPRFTGVRKMNLYLLHPKRQKAVLYWMNEDDEDEESYSFAIGVDLCQPDRQEVPLAVCEGEFYAATEALQDLILQDSGRVDA